MKDTTTILHLPDELLAMLPQYLHTLEEYVHLISTCRRLRAVLIDLTPRKMVLQLACQLASSGLAPAVLRPHPDMLVLATARQLAEWALATGDEDSAPCTDNLALQSSSSSSSSASASEEEEEEGHKTPSRLALLTTAFQSGIPGILALALDPHTTNVGLCPTLSDLRELHFLSYRTINPLTETIDAMAGTSWQSIPNFWSTVSDAFTLHGESGSATRQLLLYGELFGPSLDSYLESGGKKKPGMLDARVRIEFIKYCIPSPWCTPAERPGEVLSSTAGGPFCRGGEAEWGQREDNQTMLDHLLGGPPFMWQKEKLGSLWGRAWTRVVIAAGASKGNAWPMAWRQKLTSIKFGEDRKRDGHIAMAPQRGKRVHETEQGEEEGQQEEEGEGQSESDDDEEDHEEEGGGQSESDDDEEDHEEDNDDHPRLIRNEKDMRTEQWRFRLFWAAITQVGGLHGMEMVAQFKGREDGVQDILMKPEWKERIEHYRDLVMALDEEDRPEDQVLNGKTSLLLISQAPHIRLELYYCCCALWGGV